MTDSIGRLSIVGFGLIGASLAASLKRAGFSGEIVAVTRSDASAQQALEQGLVDHAVADIASGINEADIVLLAVPMLAMRTVMKDIAPVLSPRTVLTDAGSVKQSFIEDARAVFGSLRNIVPGHPIAGRELSGMAAADDKLYQGRRVLLTPTEETDAAAIARVSALWTLAGASVECLQAAHHDRVLAATSHLPHVLAFTMVDTLATQQEVEEIFRYAAGGFRDFTRIASSDPVMWRDICLTNREAVLASMDAFGEHLQLLRTAIDTSDGAAIESILQRARDARDAYSAE